MCKVAILWQNGDVNRHLADIPNTDFMGIHANLYRCRPCVGTRGPFFGIRVKTHDKCLAIKAIVIKCHLLENLDRIIVQVNNIHVRHRCVRKFYKAVVMSVVLHVIINVMLFVRIKFYPLRRKFSIH